MDWQARLLAALQAAQQGLLRLLDALGVASTVHGQPAWPFEQRIAIEVLAIDHALTRAAALTLACAAGAVLLVVVGGLYRRVRVATWVFAALSLAGAPWPDPKLVFGPAVPTSFHGSPSGFAVTSIAHGRSVYERHCTACHGIDAAGDGPRAGQGRMWPPDLNGPLLWRRLDGELLWSVLHGRADHRGRSTMPGFEPTLSVTDAWAVLDFLHANAAGQSLRRDGAWARPVALPDAPVRCGDEPPRQLRHWIGQRLRIVVAGGEAPLREDGRFVTVAVAPRRARGVDVDCRIEAPEALEAFARIAGTDLAGLGGMQFLTDRRGWLRARTAPGSDGWSEADLVCGTSPPGQGTPAAAIDVDALIARIDAEPVRIVKSGVPH